MRPMMPPPAGMRGPGRIGGGPRGFLTEEEKKDTRLFKTVQMAVCSRFRRAVCFGGVGAFPVDNNRKNR